MLGFALFNYLNSKKNLKVFGTIRKKYSKQKNISTNIDVKNFKLLKKKNFRNFSKYNNQLYRHSKIRSKKYFKRSSN